MGEWSPKIVAFLCTWCSYAGADLAGTSRNQYPPNIRVIRVPCSGRINPLYIIKALLEGADGVMVSGCHPGDCHYLVGNFYARRRFIVLKKLLTVAGFEANRVHFTWVSASEGVRFANVIKVVTDKVSALGPNPVGTQGDGKQGKQGDRFSAFALSKAENLSPCFPSVEAVNPTFEEQQERLFPLCKKLLEDGTVDRIIGFKEGEKTGISIPCFIDSPAESGKLVWNNRCVPNLSGYLRELTGKDKGKTAIVAKPCDARAIDNLIVENQIKRDDVFIIGLVCGGMMGDNGQLLPGCADCRVKTPPVYDVLIGEPGVDEGDRVAIEQGTSDESFERFLGEMQKCILCYSCRQACYGCYCETCFMERGEPDWQTVSPDMGAKMLYHLGRATHLSGRCVECGACENACASGVNIRYLIREVTRFIEDTYDYQTGMNLDDEPVMLTYDFDDLEIGFLHSPDSVGAGGDSDA